MAATRPDATPAREGRTGWWQCVGVDAQRVPAWLALVASDRYGDGERVELLDASARVQVGDDTVCTAHLDDEGIVRRLVPGPRGAARAPELWFGEIREPAAHPPAVNLVAFAGHGVAPWTLLEASDLAEQPVSSADQVGAVRWYPATGEVDQIYVQPAWRRRSVSLALISAAAVLSHTRGWARLWGDGQRTELGEALRAGAPWRGRSDDLTHVSRPMTPPTGA